MIENKPQEPGASNQTPPFSVQEGVIMILDLTLLIGAFARQMGYCRASPHDAGGIPAGKLPKQLRRLLQLAFSRPRENAYKKTFSGELNEEFLSFCFEA